MTDRREVCHEWGMTETQVRQLAHAAVLLWVARAINGTDDDAEHAFQRSVSEIIATTASE